MIDEEKCLKDARELQWRREKFGDLCARCKNAKTDFSGAMHLCISSTIVSAMI
jgi:hypothetical protein